MIKIKYTENMIVFITIANIVYTLDKTFKGDFASVNFVKQLALSKGYESIADLLKYYSKDYHGIIEVKKVLLRTDDLRHSETIPNNIIH